MSTTRLLRPVRHEIRRHRKLPRFQLPGETLPSSHEKPSICCAVALLVSGCRSSRIPAKPQRQQAAPPRNTPLATHPLEYPHHQCTPPTGQDYQPSSSTIIQISINVIVRPSGLLLEPSASGRGISTNDRRCIEQRVGDVVLAPLDTQVSQPVSTTIDLDYKRPEVEEYDVGGPAPKLKNVVEPLPKKETIAPSGVPIEKAPSDRIEGSRGVPIEGPKGVPVEGPKPVPIDGYEVDERSERWTD